MFSGRVNAILSQAINSDEISVNKVDKKGYVVNDDTIYKDANFEEKPKEVKGLDEI